VWPHDNSIIASGFRRYHMDEYAERIFQGILDAATYFPEYRLPEVFAGFGRSEYEVPVHYPVACHPQAWAAGSIPYLLQTCLGLEADAFSRTLRVVRPLLPAQISRIEVKRLRVGDAQMDLSFERSGEAVRVEVQQVRGDLRVEVTP
jgi:glycogen debranching enzyme